MQDRRVVRGAPLRGLAIEVVVEDGFDGAVGPGADLQRPQGGGLEARPAEGLGQLDDAEAGPEALPWMRPLLQDQVAQERRRGADGGRLAADPLDGPVDIAPM